MRGTKKNENFNFVVAVNEGLRNVNKSKEITQKNEKVNRTNLIIVY